jgi:hypothetical protein
LFKQVILECQVSRAWAQKLRMDFKFTSPSLSNFSSMIRIKLRRESQVWQNMEVKVVAPLDWV